MPASSPPDQPLCTRTTASAPNNARSVVLCPIPYTTMLRVSTVSTDSGILLTFCISQPLRHRLFAIAKPWYFARGPDVLHLLLRNQQNPHHSSKRVRFFKRRLSAAHDRIPCIPSYKNRVRTGESAYDNGVASREGVIWRFWKCGE